MPAPHRSPWRVDPAVAARILALTRFNLGPHQLAWRPGSAPLDGTWALAPPTGDLVLKGLQRVECGS